MTVQTLDLIRFYSASEICKAKYVKSFTIVNYLRANLVNM